MTAVEDQDPIIAAFEAHARRLARQEFPDAVGTGDRAPGFELPNAYGQSVTLAGLLERGPVLLVFYRGAWCPFCNAQLRALQAALPRITPLGASLVAVSPQTPDNSLRFAEEAGLDFEVLSDLDSRVATEYGIMIGLGAEDRALYLSVGNDLSAVNGSSSWTLPAPATFVIAPDGVVEYAHVDGDYTKRADVEEIVAVLGAIATC